MKVASGGELSRFLLALKVVLSDRGSAPTLVFDEIDTGVGGAVADAIGARLSRLASKVQVMAVTHAPQVAARANQHLLISKDALDDGVSFSKSFRGARSANPESRDSGSGPSDHPGMTGSKLQCFHTDRSSPDFPEQSKRPSKHVAIS
jgi:hypothetical protein